MTATHTQKNSLEAPTCGQEGPESWENLLSQKVRLSVYANTAGAGVELVMMKWQKLHLLS